MGEQKNRAGRNKTISFGKNEISIFKSRLISLVKIASVEEIENKTILQDLFLTVQFLPSAFVDLLFIDPPYNLTKNFNSNAFKEMGDDEYERWIDSWFSQLVKILRPSASVYICGDWKSYE